jgi:hypothetical protein
MSTAELGPGVTRFLSDRDRQFAFVSFQFERPPLDSELNLTGLIHLEALAESIRSRYPSGWLMNELSPRSDFLTNSNYSNLFFFGQNFSGETRNPAWAVVNGWVIPVTGTRTGQPPLNPNNTDTYNRIELNPPNTSTGGSRAEFVFLEVWLQRVDVDPPSPGIAPGKPQRGFIYRFGNVECGFDNIPDELIDPNLGFETTERVQIQYRIRVVPDINLISNPEGFDPTLVFAQGTLAVPSVIPFQNMRGQLGDPGLWRSGTGDPATFGTVDGYVYAVPICSVFRRNAAGFNDTGNLAGAFNRNSIAISREDSTIYTATPTLPAAITETTTLLTFSTISGTILSTLSSFGESFFKLDQEIVRVTNVVDTGVAFDVTIDRGQLSTTAKSHIIATPMVPYTVRPDGLYADQIASTDILDLRHAISNHFDYEAMLKTNLRSLLKSDLRTTWKRFGSSNPSGAIVLYGDRVTDSTTFVGGLSRLDGPNGNRRAFSDSVITERYVVSVRAPTNVANDPSVSQTALQLNVAPYNIQVLWTTSAPGKPGAGTGPPADRNNLGVPFWWNGDQIKIQLSDFRVGLPVTDSDQVRFVLPTEDSDAVVARFEGMTTDPAGGNPSGVPATTPSATNPTLGTAIVGNRILKNGQGLTIVADSSGNLQITFNSGVSGTPFTEFNDATQGSIDPTYAQNVLLHIEFSIVYGAGRGLSHKPDFIHTVQYLGTPANASKFMLRPGLSGKNRMVPTYLGEAPQTQVGRNRQFARTSEIMVDSGSKTTYIAPYRNILAQNLMVRNGVGSLNWYFPGPVFQGGMPLLSQDGLTTIYTTVDPLDRFYNGVQTRYVEIPFEYVPRPGLHHVPIIPTTNTVFPSGINFFLMSKEGALDASSNNSNFNTTIIAYAALPGFYIATLNPSAFPAEVYGTGSASSIFGDKYTNSNIRSENGGPFRGIKFPPFLAPARITGVYQRMLPGVVPVPVTPFGVSTRAFETSVGRAVNLLKDDFDGPTFLLDVNDQGDVVFILNADVIDFTKLTAGSTFDNTFFFVECSLFAYDRGFGQTNGRLLTVKEPPGIPGGIAVNAFLNPTDGTVGLITPSPLTTGATNNEVTIYYSRQPYQGDIFGTQSAFSDDIQRLGPLSVSEANSIRNNPVTEDTGTLPNKTGYEVLATQSFVTSLGTGRLSGPNIIPLLQPQDNPDQVRDYENTLIDISRRFSLNRVGFENWATPKFPVLEASFAARPSINLSALSEIYDASVHPDFAGCVTQLPIGAYFRDKDFIGKILYQVKTANGAAAVNLGELSEVGIFAPTLASPAGRTTWEGTEFVAGSASATTGGTGEALIRVDGTSNFNDSTRFKTTRGAAGYSASNPHPGAPIEIRFPKSRPNSDVGSVLVGTAYLIRSQPEIVSGTEVHPGNELQMMIVTQAIPAYFKETDLDHSANGTGEGFSAIDRFRCLAHPLEKRRGRIDTSISPTRKPIFTAQITSNDVEFGSGDLPLISVEQETLPVTFNGQTDFDLTFLPADTSTVMMFINGVKSEFGVDYTVGGPGVDDNRVVHVPLFPDNPPLLTTDVVEFWYVRK